MSDEPLTAAEVDGIADGLNSGGVVPKTLLLKLVADWRRLTRQLETACHINADDKVLFDFAVLDELESKDAEIERLKSEISVNFSNIPNACKVTVCEGAGEVSREASLAVSIAKMAAEIARLRAELSEIHAARGIEK